MTGALAELAARIRRTSGVVISDAQEVALRGAIGRAAPGLAPEQVLTVLRDPLRGPPLMDRLIDEITVQESTFGRDPGQLNGIPWRELLATAQREGARALRVWSAGCAAGEEPYTLALLALEEFGPVGVVVDVLGTDISKAALAAAARGRYRERALAPLPATLRQRYLSRQDDGTYQIADRLRRLVRFRLHNLVADPVPPLGEAAFDLIVCRNVLIYFDQPVAHRLVEALERSLRPGGLLLLGVADALVRPHMTDGAVRLRSQAPGPWPVGLAAARRPLAGLGPQPAGKGPGAPAPPARGAGPGGGTPGDGQLCEREGRLSDALTAAGRGDLEDARARVASLLADNPLDADANFVDGLVALDAGEPANAVAALRRALYTDVTFALAAFELGRAYDALGDRRAARSAYARALRTLDPDDRRHELMLQQIDIGDIAAACRARLGG